MKHPIDNVQWIPSRELKANNYNPNAVLNSELKLLEESILSNGWVFPIVVNPNNIIIDGFHRWQLSLTSQKIRERDAEEVPCVVVDISDREAMMMTVRMNRAKGQHVAFRMSDLVQSLVDDYDVTPEEMIQKMGMTPGEVELLYDGSLLKRHKLKDYKYSNAWVPVDTDHLSEEERKKVLDGELFEE